MGAPSLGLSHSLSAYKMKCFRDPTLLCLDMRHDQRRFLRLPDVQHSCIKSACVDDAQLAALDVRMPLRASKSNWRLGDDTSGPAGCERDITAQTVSRLCHQGYVTESVEALSVLVEIDGPVSTSIFYTVLKNSVVKENLVLGRRVHALMVRKGYESDTFLCNHVLRMYASHGLLQDAMDVFTGVAIPDAFMWSSLISAQVKLGQDMEAKELYHRMRRSSVKPDGHVFVAALQACARGADLSTGQELHADVVASGLEHDMFVCNSLVDMYAKCGSMEDAQRVFDGIVQKDVVTWTALIAGYVQQGMGQEALRLYGAMQKEGIALPNSVTFVCLLQACASVGSSALEKVKELHTQIREGGHEADAFVANSLVNIYAKCCSLEDARRVFDGLSRKDVVTWNAMIAGYSQQGMGQEALHLYSAMQEEGIIRPDTVTMVCLLQACATVGSMALETGKQLHTQIREQEYEADKFVASSLVNMYAKCGSLEDARRVFDGLNEKDVVTWNTMIAGYSQQNMGQEALCLYSALQEEDIAVPDSLTFVCLLRACASVGIPALEMGKQLHTQSREQGHQSDVSVASSLVNMYAKCGSLEDAQRVFDGLGQKTVVTWTAIISGYVHQGMFQEALRLYRDMLEENIAVPDSVMFVSLFQACASVGTTALGFGMELHTESSRRGHDGDVLVGNSLVDMYVRCGSLEDAKRVFNGLNTKDVVSWNAMIQGLSQQGLAQEALSLYSAMQMEGIHKPTPMTFLGVLRACASLGTPALEKGKDLHIQIREHGYVADAFVATSLVNMYAKCGSLGDAQRVLERLDRKNVVTWTALIAGYSQQGMGREALRIYSAMQEEGIAVPDAVTYASLLQACAKVGRPVLEMGRQIHQQIREDDHEDDVFIASSLVNMYAKCGSLEEAERVFDDLVQKDVVTCTAMIAGYSQQGMGQEALRVYRTMQEEGIAIPDSVTFVCLLQACANVAALHVGRELHSQIEEQGLHSDVLVAGSLMNMYSKCGSMVEAQQIFDALSERDVVIWSTLIAGYTHQGDTEAVFDLVHRMREGGVQPVSMTFLSILTTCSHAGLVNKGREYFEAMSRDHSISPTVEHYTSMVDILSRAGLLDEALALVKTMPVLPNAAVWHTLLGACRKWSNMELGLYAFDRAVQLDENDTSAYLLMSNIYADAQMWEESQDMQARRVRTRALKQPGQCWWTDMEGVVHSFLVQDTNHSKSQSITETGLIKNRIAVI